MAPVTLVIPWQVVTRSSTEHPFDVAAGGGWVVWTDWVARGVFRAAPPAPAAAPLRRDVPRAMAVVIVAPDHQTCEHALRPPLAILITLEY